MIFSWIPGNQVDCSYMPCGNQVVVLPLRRYDMIDDILSTLVLPGFATVRGIEEKNVHDH